MRAPAMKLAFIAMLTVLPNEPGRAQDIGPIIGPRARPPDGTRAKAVERGLSLTHSQRRWVFSSIQHSGIVGPNGFRPTIGMNLPQQIELYPLPRQVTAIMPALKDYRYAKVNLKVLLVDEDRRLVEIIENPLL